MEKSKIYQTKIQFKHNFPLMFYNKEIMSHFYPFLWSKKHWNCEKLSKKDRCKRNEKKIKEKVKNYIIDFGKNNDKVKYSISEDGVLNIFGNIFNFRKEFLKEFSHVKYKDEILKLEQSELNQYLHVLPKNELILSNNDKTTAKVCKYIIGYDYFDQSMKDKNKKNKEDSDSEDEKTEQEKRYQMFYGDENLEDLKNIDFTNKELMIERQRKILEQMNKINIDEFYPEICLPDQLLEYHIMWWGILFLWAFLKR